MTDTPECPSCGARDSEEAQETNEGAEIICSDCGYRFYPPEDRHDYQTRAALRKKPKTPSFTINWEKFGDPSEANKSPRSS
jgi:hypothetical protein